MVSANVSTSRAYIAIDPHHGNAGLLCQRLRPRQPAHARLHLGNVHSISLGPGMGHSHPLLLPQEQLQRRLRRRR